MPETNGKGPSALVPDRRDEVRGLDGRFLPGHSGGGHGGRKAGSVLVKAKVRRILGRELLEALAVGTETLPSAFARWALLLTSEDQRVRLEAEKFLHEVTHGRAPVTLQLAGPGGSGELILRWSEARPGSDVAPPALPAAPEGSS